MRPRPRECPPPSCGARWRRDAPGRGHRVGGCGQVDARPPDRRGHRPAGDPPRSSLLVPRLGPDARPRVVRAQRDLLTGDTGSSTATTAGRSSCAAELADTVVFLDLPRRICLARADPPVPLADPAGPRMPAAGGRRVPAVDLGVPPPDPPAPARDPRHLRRRRRRSCSSGPPTEVRAFLAGLRRARGAVPAPTIRDDGPVKRIGLVLGAGGLTGQAFHAGVLSALDRGHRMGSRAPRR